MSKRQRAKDAVTEVVRPRRGERRDVPSPTRRAVVKAALTAPVATVLFESQQSEELSLETSRSRGVRDGR
ncbi:MULTISPECIES: hypothetical protein [Protofrankia]|uniref:hypothetical protein n=1 Tax=Protofrankia TaxID=2994361 RepID=UPI00064046C2|nr:MULTISPECIES: hypothetical protein [Protofrankia]